MNNINIETMLHAVENEFTGKRVMVFGDLMVDEYIVGKVSRISPEAPVPVLNFREKHMEAGGASNVANNLNSLGCVVSVVGVAAEDEAGRWLREHLVEKGMQTEGIFAEKTRPTIVKTRFATKGQQLLRMDNEITGCIEEETQMKIISYLKSKVAELDAVVLSDYKKGVLESRTFVAEIIRICNENNVLISIDSKSRNIEAFKNADFVKPNNLELEEAVGMKITDDSSLNEAGKVYLYKSGAKCLIVTRGAAGISVFLPDQKRKDFPSKAVQVFDVTGAGDTVISTITLGMISGLKLEDAVYLANLAASVVISKVGTVPVMREELMERIHEA